MNHDDEANATSSGVWEAPGWRNHAEVTTSTFSGAEHSDESFAPHNHDSDQLQWFPDGGMDAVVGGQRWLIDKATVLWIPAGVMHSSRLLGAGSTLSIYLNPKLRPAGEKWTRPRALVLDSLLGEIMRHIPGRPLSALRREACCRLVVDLLDGSEDRETTMPLPVHPAARKVAESIIDDPGDKTQLCEWAERHGVSARTLARAFQSQTGHRFSEWRTKTRMLASLSLLMDGKPIHQVGSALGCVSAGGFIDAFSREFGSTPAVYARARH